MKLRFWMSYTNNRGKTYGAGVADGYAVHVRGRDAGVEVTPVNDNGNDAFRVEMTRGSNGGMGGRKLLGRVVATPDGPNFHPAP